MGVGGGWRRFIQNTGVGSGVGAREACALPPPTHFFDGGQWVYIYVHVLGGGISEGIV